MGEEAADKVTPLSSYPTAAKAVLQLSAGVERGEVWALVWAAVVVAGGQNPVSVYLLRSEHLAFNYTRPEVSWDLITSASNPVNSSLSFFPTFCSPIPSTHKEWVQVRMSALPLPFVAL